MEIERQIVEALQKATIDAVKNSTVPTMPVKVLGRTFETPNDGKYLEIVHIPNNVLGEFWGDEKTHRGLWRLLLHWPVDDAGQYPPLDALASICTPFVKGALFPPVKIYEKPDYAGAIEGSPSRFFQVSIRYMSFQS